MSRKHRKKRVRKKARVRSMRERAAKIGLDLGSYLRLRTQKHQLVGGPPTQRVLSFHRLEKQFSLCSFKAHIIHFSFDGCLYFSLGQAGYVLESFDETTWRWVWKYQEADQHLDFLSKVITGMGE